MLNLWRVIDNNGTIPSGGTGTTAASPTYPDNDYKASGSLTPNAVTIPGAFTTSNNHYFNPPNIYVAQASNVLLSQNDEIKIYGNFFLAPEYNCLQTLVSKSLMKPI